MKITKKLFAGFLFVVCYKFAYSDSYSELKQKLEENKQLYSNYVCFMQYERVGDIVIDVDGTTFINEAMEGMALVVGEGRNLYIENMHKTSGGINHQVLVYDRITTKLYYPENNTGLYSEKILPQITLPYFNINYFTSFIPGASLYDILSVMEKNDMKELVGLANVGNQIMFTLEKAKPYLFRPHQIILRKDKNYLIEKVVKAGGKVSTTYEVLEYDVNSEGLTYPKVCKIEWSSGDKIILSVYQFETNTNIDKSALFGFSYPPGALISKKDLNLIEGPKFVEEVVGQENYDVDGGKDFTNFGIVNLTIDDVKQLLQ